MSVYDPVIISNMALRLIGIFQAIDSLDDASHRAQICKQCYPIARDLALSGFQWPFINRQVALGLVATKPNTDWGYSYRYPVNCVLVRRIVSTALPVANPVPYQLGQDATGKLIYCNEASAIVEYSATAEETGEWSDALAAFVAAELAIQLAPGFKVGGSALQNAQSAKAMAKMTAQGIAGQELQRHPPVASRYVTARGGVYIPPPVIRTSL